jgi:hypothetical protein
VADLAIFGGGAVNDDDLGVVRQRPVLDLSRLTSPDELAGIRRIEQVALVIVPDSLAGAYAAIPSTRVAATVFVPDGAPVRTHTGAMVVGGDGLGAEGDVLVVTGLLIITSPVTGDLPSRITVIGSVIAPRGSESKLGPRLAGGTGTVSYYRHVDGQEVEVLTGQVTLSATRLANRNGSADDLLIAAGQVVVTGPVGAVGYREVHVAGQFVGPEASREVLEPAVRVQGQAGWYRSDVARVIQDDTTVGPDFFRLLDGPVSLVVLGDLTITGGVTEAALRDKVSDIVLLGDVIAPADLVPVLQVLAVDAYGTIRADDGSGR